MSHIEDQDPFAEKSFDLGELVMPFVKGWKIIILSVAIAVLIAAVYLHTATYYYRAQMQVTPVQSSNENTTPNRLGALGGLASLAGLALPADTSGIQFRLYVESLQSRDLAADLAKNPEIMKTVFANEWDGTANTWREPQPNLLERIKRPVRALLGYPDDPWTAPDAARLQQFLQLNLQIEEDAKKPYLATIVFDTTDPKFGVDFLNALNSAADNHLRQKALARASQYVNYLSNKLGTVTIGEHREAIMEALSEQEKFAMVASSSAPFAADLFDRPSALSTPVKPLPRDTIVIALVLGAVLGAGLVYAMDRRRRSVR